LTLENTHTKYDGMRDSHQQVTNVKTPKYMTSKEVAYYYLVTLKTLCRWLIRGVGPRPIKFPCGCIYYYKSDVESTPAPARLETSDPIGDGT
jgi:hypothetical protein